MSRSGIVLAGVVVLDIVHVVDHWPAEETISFIDRTEYGAGGPPHNAGAGLLKLGAAFPVTLIGAMGDDGYRDILLRSARSYGLDTSHMREMKGGITSHTLVMSDAVTGRRTFFVQVGVNARIDVDDLLPDDDSAKLYYLGSPGVCARLDSTGGWQQVLHKAKQRGFLTCMELVPVEAPLLNRLVPPCLPMVDYFVANDHEAEAVAGMTVTKSGRLDWAAAEACCRRLLEMGVNRMAAIHHPDGAVAVTRAGETVRRGSVQVPPEHIIGSVGAGDAFYAGVLYGIHENWPLGRCLDLGNAAAATSLQSATTSASIRPWRDSLAYAEAHGLRAIAEPA